MPSGAAALDPVQQARPVLDGRCAEASDELETGRAGGADHPDAELAGLLEHADADRSGGPVQQHGLARARPRDVQQVGRGGPDQQQVGRLREGQRGGLGEHAGARHRDRGRVAPGDLRGDDLVTDRPAAGGQPRARAERADHPGHLVPDRQRQQLAVLAGCDVLGVSGIHPDSAHVDPDVAGPGVGHLDVDQAQNLGPAEVDGHPLAGLHQVPPCPAATPRLALATLASSSARVCRVTNAGWPGSTRQLSSRPPRSSASNPHSS